jgi:hypothetical protein
MFLEPDAFEAICQFHIWVQYQNKVHVNYKLQHGCNTLKSCYSIAEWFFGHSNEQALKNNPHLKFNLGRSFLKTF